MGVVAGVVFGSSGARPAYPFAANPVGAVTASQTGPLTETLSGNWDWSGMPAKCGPGTAYHRAVGWAVQWSDGVTGNRVRPEGAARNTYLHVGTATDNAVHHSDANSGLGDCGTATSRWASGTWGPITHTYARPGTYTACVVIYDIHYATPEFTSLATAIGATETHFPVNHAHRIRKGMVLVVNSEQMLVTRVHGYSVTVDRHVNGTSGASHDRYALVRAIVLNRPTQSVAGSNGHAYRKSDHNSYNSAERTSPNSTEAQCLPVTFTIGAPALAPTVTSTSPASGATNVAPQGAITVNFSELVDATGSAFTIECPTGTPVSFSQSATPATSVTLTPSSPLPVSTVCTVTVVASQVTDASGGTPMGVDDVFSFTTDTPPSVTSTVPADSTSDVNADSTVTINFSKAVNASASSFSLECPTGTPVAYNLSASPASSFTLTPTSSLPAGTTCTVTVHAADVTDVDAGSPMATDYTSAFTTDTPPTVTSTAPTDNAVDVNAGSAITVDFSKSVSATGSAFSVECPTGTPIALDVSSSPASSYTLTPTSPLPASTVCTVTVDHTQITDASSTEMAADAAFSFTVDTPPTVTSTAPADSAIDVPLDSTITVNFSKTVTNTSAFSLECPAGTPVAFSTGASPAGSYTLTPTSNLPPDTDCTVTVHASGIEDGSSTSMVSDYAFTFHTVAPLPVAVNDGPSTDYSATGGVPINIGSGIGVLSNDTLYGGSISSYGAPTGLEDTSIGTATGTAQGGFVTLNADGSFHYDPPSVPPAGGTDTFKYTLTNTTGPNTATVTLNVANQLVFVDGSAVNSTKTGSLDHPYHALADVPSGRNTGGVLFFYSGSYTRSDADGVTLKTGEYLIGQGVALSSNLPFTLAPDSVSLPGSSTNPVISSTFAGANAITLGSGNTVKGVTAGAAPGSSIFGSSFGTLTISNTTIANPGATGGAALSLTTGTFGSSSSLDSVGASPSTSAAGVSLTSVTGSLTISAGTIGANSSGSAFNVSAGSVSVTDSGSVSQSGSGALLNVAGGHSGTLTFNTGSLGATSGTGLQFNNADGTYTLSNGSTLNGGNAHVDVTNGSSGTMNLNSSPITNPSSTAFNVNGSNATVSDSGTISKTSSGQLVDIESNTGGSVSISGSLSATSSATGVKLASNSGGTYTFSGGTKTLSTSANDAVAMTSNTGSTIHFSGGGLASTTTSGSGFKATGGGTIDVTGSSNTISTTTGSALDVENTTIGASGLTFQSISANGGSHGIVLDTTGSSGGLTVSGNGSADTGGTINGISGSDLGTVLTCGSVGSSPAGVGVYLNSTKSPSLSYMNFTGTFGNFGILGYGVTGSTTLDHLSMTGTFGNNEVIGESTVYFCNLTGSAAITNSSISNGAADNIAVLNDGGSLNRLTMTSDTVGLNQSGGNIGTLIEGCISAVCGSATTLNTTVEDSTFNGAYAAVVTFLGNQGSTMDTIFGQPGHGNTVHNSAATLGAVSGSENFEVASNGDATFDVNSNHFDLPTASDPLPASGMGGIIIDAANGNGNLMGYVRNNTVGNSGSNNSGTWSANALDAETNGGGYLKLLATNNTLLQWGGFGMFLKAGTGSPSGHSVDATVTNNTLLQPTADALTNVGNGFEFNSGTASGDAFTSCLDYAGNSEAGSGQGDSAGDIRLRQRFNTVVQMPGYAGASNGGGVGVPDLVSYIQGLNSGSPAVTATTSTASGGGFFNTPGGAACPLPTN